MAIRSELSSVTDSDLRWLDDWGWVIPGIVASAAIHAIYLLTHPYPSFGAGLFLLMAEQISQHGYQLPRTIPYYAEPVPFAYSPLMFYVVAALRDVTGLGGIEVTRILPGLVITLTLVPFFLFVDELVGSERVAGLATFLVAISPPVLQWHISAGGIVRAPAALFTVAGLYTGLRLFRESGRQWLIASLVLFALTILTHPVYTVFFVVSYLWLFASFSRSARGLVDGGVVGLGGLGLTMPWWGRTIDRFGLDIFTGAAGTHGGIGNQLPELANLFTANLPLMGPQSLNTVSRSGVLLNVKPHLFNLSSSGTLLLFGWFLFILGSTAHLSINNELRASRENLFLTGWLLLSMGLVSKLRFSFLIGAIIFSIVLVEYGIPAFHRVSPESMDRGTVAIGFMLLIGVLGLTIGGLYAGSNLDSHAGSTSQPQFIDDADIAAMEWAKSSTDPMAQFVVMGDAAEWFPYWTHRRILMGPWGIEWLGHDAYQRHLRQYNRISTCQHEACVTSTLMDSNVNPDYLYVPASQYTVRGMETQPSPFLREELIQSEHYRLVHENEGVMIFAVEFQSSTERKLKELGSGEERTESTETDPPLTGSSSGIAHGVARAM